MSTVLWIEKVTIEEINSERQEQNRDYLELSEEFLYNIIVNEEMLKSILTNKEIDLIKPNWGEIQLKSTANQ